jgi:2-dehydro-3-deoxy-D-gluconate 5-dehydrogenase
LAEAGASICLVLRQSPEGVSPNLATLTAIQALNVKVQVIYCDLGDLDAVKGVFQKALDVMGGQIDVLVNCAGIQRRNPSVDFSENDWDDVSSVRPHLISRMLIIHWNAINK